MNLLEAGPQIANGGSSQPIVADHPHVSSDDNRLARLSRGALSLARTHELELASRGIQPPAPIGRLDLAQDSARSERQREAVARLGLPESLVTHLERDDAGERAGVRLAAGGLWFPGCRAVAPANQCRQWLEAAADRVRVATSMRVARLEPRDGRWALFGESGAPLAEASVVILANAGDALRLGSQSVPQLRRVRGQTTLLDDPALAPLRTVIGATAYACPLGDGRVSVGSTFDDGDSLVASAGDDLSNLRRLSRSLAPPPAGFSTARYRSGPVGFRWVTRDRIPMIGALPNESVVRANAAEHARDDRLGLAPLKGVYGAFAFGSRGLLWARLAAEVLGALADREPVPLETDLLAALDPSRFLRDAIRRGRI